MAGTIIADKIQTENTFLTLNVGATQIATMNTSGIYSSSGTKMIGTDGSIGNSTISGATVSGNLSFDSIGTSGIRLPAANTLSFHTAGTEDMRITSTGIIAVGTTTPNTTNKLEVSGNVGLSWAGNTFIGMKFNDGNAYKMGMQLNNVTRETLLWSQSSDSDDKITFHTGSGPTERMRITTAGIVTKPYNPAFYAYMNGGGTTLFASNANFVFDTVSVNTGNHYSTSTGRFTAPVSGWYHFSTTILTQSRSNGDQMEIGIYNSAGTLGALAARTIYQSNYTGYGGYISGSCSCTFYLSAGDYMRVQNACGTSVYINSGPWAFFSGHLVG